MRGSQLLHVHDVRRGQQNAAQARETAFARGDAAGGPRDGRDRKAEDRDPAFSRCRARAWRAPHRCPARCRRSRAPRSGHGLSAGCGRYSLAGNPGSSTASRTRARVSARHGRVPSGRATRSPARPGRAVATARTLTIMAPLSLCCRRARLRAGRAGPLELVLWPGDAGDVVARPSAVAAEIEAARRRAGRRAARAAAACRTCWQGSMSPWVMLASTRPNSLSNWVGSMHALVADQAGQVGHALGELGDHPLGEDVALLRPRCPRADDRARCRR